MKIINAIWWFILHWIWQFPQMLAGTIMLGVLKAEKRVVSYSDGDTLETFTYYHFNRDTAFRKYISGVSLCCYTFLSDNNADEITVRHEYGHYIGQSIYWGWLYLPVVGVYSAVFCNLKQRREQSDWLVYDRLYWYYLTRWTEIGADKAAGITEKRKKQIMRYYPRNGGTRFPKIEL